MIHSRLPILTDDVGLHYDELDRFYREIWGDHVHHGLWLTGKETPREATDQLTQHVASFLQLQPGDRVCDVGCGYGESARQITNQFQVDVYGVTGKIACCSNPFAVKAACHRWATRKNIRS